MYFRFRGTSRRRFATERAPAPRCSFSCGFVRRLWYHDRFVLCIQVLAVMSSPSRKKGQAAGLPVHRSPLAAVAASLLRVNEENQRRADLGLSGPSPASTRLDSGLIGDGPLPRAVALTSVQEAAILSASLQRSGAKASGALGPQARAVAARIRGVDAADGGAGAGGIVAITSRSSEAAKRAATADMTAAERVLATALQAGSESGAPAGVVDEDAAPAAGGFGSFARKPPRRPRSASAAIQIAEAVAAGAVPASLVGVRSAYKVPARLLFHDESCTKPREGV